MEFLKELEAIKFTDIMPLSYINITERPNKENTGCLSRQMEYIPKKWQENYRRKEELARGGSGPKNRILLRRSSNK